MTVNIGHRVVWSPHARGKVAAAGSVVVIAGLGIGLWRLAPHVSWKTSTSALVDVQTTGWQATLHHAVFVTSKGQTVKLVRRGQGLWPQSPLNANVQGAVHIQLHVPWPWSMWQGQTRNIQRQQVTPSIPHLMTNHVTWPLGRRLPLSFSQSVAMVQIGRASHRWTPESGSNIAVGGSARTPNRSGTIWIRSKSRVWETPGAPVAVHWWTVPYLAANATQSSVMPQGPFVVKFSQPIARPHTSRWTVAPNVSGKWVKISSRQFRFVPASTITGPGGLVSVTIPGGSQGPQTKSGSFLASSTTVRWPVQPGSVLRLQQLLASLGYLPVTWTSAGSPNGSMASQQQAVYKPPAGTFAWKYVTLPGALKKLWVPGQMNVVTQGAIMQFERANGLPVDGVAGPQVWAKLIHDRLNHVTNPYGYSYIYVTEQLPQTLELWINGHLKMHTLVNTGISQTPTFVGTFPIYERLSFQVMRGKNPNGVPYADPVHWINYFAGGDAVHGFTRASYGFPQSLGCVELPPSIADTVYHQVHYGTLVTVAATGSPPS